MGDAVTSRVTSKGQITIPEAVRKRLGLQRGDEIEWRLEDDGRVAVRKVGRELDDLVGMLGAPTRSLSLDEIDEAVRDRHRGDAGR